MRLADHGILGNLELTPDLARRNPGFPKFSQLFRALSGPFERHNFMHHPPDQTGQTVPPTFVKY